MDKINTDNKYVEKALKNLKSIIDLKLLLIGDYLPLIVPKDILTSNLEYSEKIINDLFWKFCDELKDNVTNDDIEFIMYKSFVNNNPSDELINYCFEVVNDCITNQKNSETDSLKKLLDPIKDKISEDEFSKSLTTIIDILLDYYSIIRY